MVILQKSIQGAVMILVIAAVRGLFINRLPKRTFLVLWAVVVFSLLFPFSLKSRFSVYSFVGKGEAVMEAVQEKTADSRQTAEQMEERKGADASKEEKNVSFQWNEKNQEPSIDHEKEGAENTVGERGAGQEENALAGTGRWELGQKFPLPVWWRWLWLAGAGLCTGYFGIAYFRCRREFSASLPVRNEIADKWLDVHPLRRTIAIRQSGSILAPLTYGIFSPVILVPKTTKWECEEEAAGHQAKESFLTDGSPAWISWELSLCLEHEFVHIKRLDAVTKMVLTAVLCLHWFNPMVWVMYVLANRDLELSCDEAVVKTFGENMKSVYARTLIRMEETKSALMPLCNNFSKNAIEERITAVMKIKKFNFLTIMTAVALVIGITLAFATLAAEEVDTRSESVKAFLGNSYTQEEGENANKFWDYFYSSLNVDHSLLEDEDKSEPGSMEMEDPYNEENERESRQHPYGTRADYDSLLALKTKDYESMFLEDFNEKLLDWCNKNPEAMERTGTDAFENDYQVELTEEEKRFVALTVQLSRLENSEWITSLHTGKPEEDPWWGGENYVESDDNMWCRLYFQFSYHISDKSRVTVGERDRCIGGMTERILEFWRETELEKRVALSEEEVIGWFETLAEECGSRQVEIKIDKDRIKYERMDERESAKGQVYLGTVKTEGSLRNYISAGEEMKYSKYFHMTVANHMEKEISCIEYSMLAYDSKGRPLRVYWYFMDSNKPASYECTVTKWCRIPPGETLDNEGGWSIMEPSWGLIDLNGYGTDYEVEYVLSCVSRITFEDGMQWNNPDYEKWQEECKGKTVPYSVFKEYGQKEYEIYCSAMED